MLFMPQKWIKEAGSAIFRYRCTHPIFVLLEWVSRVLRPSRHIGLIGHFGDECLQANTCTGTDNSKERGENTPETQKYSLATYCFFLVLPMIHEGLLFTFLWPIDNLFYGHVSSHTIETLWSLLHCKLSLHKCLMHTHLYISKNEACDQGESRTVGKFTIINTSYLWQFGSSQKWRFWNGVIYKTCYTSFFT